MLSISRSRLNLAAQSGFFIVNSGGVILAMLYNSRTPDLYPHNAHHTIGWLLTWATVAQVCLALIAASARLRGEKRSSEEHLPFIQSLQQSVGGSQWANNPEDAPGYRFSDDSGHGTEQNDESLRGNSSSSLEDDRSLMNGINRKYYEAESDDLASSSKRSRHTLMKRLRAVISGKVPLYVSSRVTGLLRIIEAIITRTILIQGFVGITTGAVTYAGLFVCIPSHKANLNLTASSEEELCSPDLPISSRAECSSGTEYSRWAAGPEALQTVAGCVLFLQYAFPY